MKFYRPHFPTPILDVITLLVVFGVVLGWFPLTTQIPFIKYSNFILIFASLWIVLSYFFKRYKPRQGYFKSVLNLFYTALSVFVILWILIHFFFDGIFSERVLWVVTVGVFSLEYLILFIYSAYRYATNYSDSPKNILDDTLRENAQVIPTEPVSEKQYQTLISLMHSFAGKKTTDFLEKTTDLHSGNLRVFFANDINELKLTRNYQYSAFVQMQKLNDMRQVNEMFYQMNTKLADNGIFICRFESKSTWKKNILKKYPAGLNYIVYSFWFFVKRIIPRLILTHRLYYDITNGKNRIFSKAEVLGRLIYSGFTIVKERKIDNLTYVIARRSGNPFPPQALIYGLLIKLVRVGKNGKPFKVYKVRTMHPYSEYLQAYIFDKNSLKEGGKINQDIRITTLGGFMRKYWIDELPMLINVLKGDMKIVGVRPLSQHYFSLYSKELQEKRTKFKPGLLPPFYADMPKTLDEIQQSEMTYLEACEKKGVFITDVRYFFKILNNILFKKARSA
jgi:lipopolysaccharide/colanic/teichoic acid biosynthesis glycosyltransferase